jgi:hypothetical protein
MHPASRLCLPLPCLRCQDTSSAPPRSHCLVLHLCLSSPLWAYWDPSLPWKTHTMVPFHFLKLFPHLVCQASQSKAALYQLLGTSGGKGLQKTAAAPHVPYPSHHKGRRENKQVHSCTGMPALGTVVMPAIAKVIHREGLVHIQSLQGYRVGPGQTGSLVPHMGWGGMGLCTGPIPSPASCIGPDQLSPWSQFLSQSYGPPPKKEALM